MRIIKQNMMEKIKLPKIHYACANNGLRESMEYILVTKDEVAATNGTILVVHKTSDIFDSDFVFNMPERILIHKNQWKLLCDNALTISIDEYCIAVQYEGYKVSYPISTEERLGIKYPKYNSVFPKKEDVESIDSIGINPVILYQLSQAMLTAASSSNGLKFEFYGKARGILITPVDYSNNAKALLMPVILS